MMKQKKFSKWKTILFDHPEKDSENKKELDLWQSINKDFWESNPMRYDWVRNVPYSEGSAEYYSEIDRRFFSEIQAVMPWKKIPFDNLINFDALKDESVLEIGTGIGSHAELISQYAKSYVGIDLTRFSYEKTLKRLQLNNSKENYEIIEMNAEQLLFSNDSFDQVWSWGVIHHSASTKNILNEIFRVLKPEGSAKLMVYHRGWWNYYFVGFVFHGIIKAGFLKHKTLSSVVQANTDGAIARYYTIKSWKNLSNNLFSVESVLISGNRADLFPIPRGKIKSFLIDMIPNKVLRFFLTNCKMGSFLILDLKKLAK